MVCSEDTSHLYLVHRWLGPPRLPEVRFGRSGLQVLGHVRSVGVGDVSLLTVGSSSAYPATSATSSEAPAEVSPAPPGSFLWQGFGEVDVLDTHSNLTSATSSTTTS